MYKHEHLITQDLSVTADPEARWSPFAPPNFTHAGSWATRARFTILVSAVTGSPSAFNLGFTLQSCYLGSNGAYRYQSRVWYDLAVAGQVPSLTSLVTQSTSLPFRRVINLDLTDVADMGADIRLNRSLSFTGGTTPALKMDIMRELWS
jgi:hypothetical protein